MPNYDPVFTDKFKQQWSNHLVTDGDAMQKIKDATSGAGIGQLSRIFNYLALPSPDLKKFKKNFEKADGLENYMRPMLKDIATELLAEDNSMLSNKAIEVIGEENYEALKGLEITDTEIATQVMAAVILSYSQSIASLASELAKTYENDPEKMMEEIQIFSEKYINPMNPFAQEFNLSMLETPNKTTSSRASNIALAAGGFIALAAGVAAAVFAGPALIAAIGIVPAVLSVGLSMLAFGALITNTVKALSSLFKGDSAEQAALQQGSESGLEPENPMEQVVDSSYRRLSDNGLVADIADVTESDSDSELVSDSDLDLDETNIKSTKQEVDSQRPDEQAEDHNEEGYNPPSP